MEKGAVLLLWYFGIFGALPAPDGWQSYEGGGLALHLPGDCKSEAQDTTREIDGHVAFAGEGPQPRSDGRFRDRWHDLGRGDEPAGGVKAAPPAEPFLP